MTKLLENESGYSLVEVMVAIMILAVAIIPMVGMFDMGLNTATQGSKYDKARALANKQLEESKSRSYTDARDNFPLVGSSAPDPTTGVYVSSDLTDAEFPGFTYKVRKAYTSIGTSDLVETPTAKTMMTVTVTVNWGGNKSYSVMGLVTK